jgi:regulator of protease activity HflC (stomatin/prohibitin superfamily)
MEDEGKTAATIAGIVILVIVLGIGFFGSLIATPAGHINIVLQGGKAVGTRDPGFSCKAPLIEGTQTMSLQTMLYNDDNSSAGTKDLQGITTSIAINYHLDPRFAVEVYNTLGINYIDKVAHPVIQETLKEVTARHPAEEMITQREAVKDEIAKLLTERLSSRHIVVETVSIKDFRFSEKFDAAIEAKVAAQQAVQQAEYKLQQIKVEAAQAVAQAKGQADAIEALKSTLTPEYLQYLYINKLAPDVKVIVVPAGMPIVLPQP